jgi:hypothetical protein
VMRLRAVALVDAAVGHHLTGPENLIRAHASCLRPAPRLCDSTRTGEAGGVWVRPGGSSVQGHSASLPQASHSPGPGTRTAVCTGHATVHTLMCALR